jgi:hypothetical protein
MVGRPGVLGGVFSASAATAVLLATIAAAGAQTPPGSPPPPSPPPAQASPKPVTGFVPPFEIMRTVRAAGFHPLAPPLRDGTIYVLRATDYRGIPMRVVLDARTGVIRDVTRIVSAASDPYGLMSPAYGVSTDALPDAYDAPSIESNEGNGTPPMTPPVVAPKPARSATVRSSSPPLPRPRPAALASQKTGSPQKPGNTGAAAVPRPRGNSAKAQPPAGANASAIGADPGPATVPGNAPPVAPLND